MSDLNSLQERLQFAIATARKAGDLILSYYQTQNLKVEQKRDRSLVTQADKEAEALIRKEIERIYPNDSILGEELGLTARDENSKWILDPIDGTQSFVCGVPLFGCLIGYISDGSPKVGVCYFPALDEIYYAASGLGSWWQTRADSKPRPARVSEVGELKDGLLCTTMISGFEKVGRAFVFEELHRQFGLYRGWSDCYGYALVATGRAELAIDPIMNVWDCAALEPIIREAGGFFGSFAGVAGIDAGEAIGCNARLKGRIVEICSLRS